MVASKGRVLLFAKHQRPAGRFPALLKLGSNSFTDTSALL